MVRGFVKPDWKDMEEVFPDTRQSINAGLQEILPRHLYDYKAANTNHTGAVSRPFHIHTAWHGCHDILHHFAVTEYDIEGA